MPQWLHMRSVALKLVENSWQIAWAWQFGSGAQTVQPAKPSRLLGEYTAVHQLSLEQLSDIIKQYNNWNNTASWDSTDCLA